MIREKVHTFGIAHALMDLALTVLAFLAAYALRKALLPADLRDFMSLARIGWMLYLIVPVWFLLLQYEQAYFTFEQRSLATICYRAAKAVLEGLGILFAAIFFRRAFAQSRLFILLFGLIDTALVVGLRLLIFRLRSYLYSRGVNFHSVLIVGTDERARKVAELLKERSQWGFHVAGFVRPAGSPKTPSDGAEIVGDVKDLGEILHRSSIDWVIFAVGPEDLELVRSGIESCEEVGVQASYMIGDVFPMKIARMHLESYDGTALLTFTTTTTYYMSLFLKGIADRVVALLGIVALSPLLLLTALLIKLTSSGPILFRQERCGLNGRRFMMYKFRTMTEGAEDMLEELRMRADKECLVVFKAKNDPRVTRVGRFLRKFSLDELPQLSNVLKGQMSLVGPRPPIPSEVEKYERWQRRRLSMKPGLTCIWQVRGRNEIDFEEWMALDLEYIDNWSLTLDARILLKTVPVVLSGKGAY
jgi:exopolysaccharide biosynthesis polyprenyl glycosylphosphotransferase